ncbi:right-handed parallel beta-helix repeat-containing protein, partial [bacterium]|nr:right-handed parallel beta-helix repeat-containing protein [bacterium]
GRSNLTVTAYAPIQGTAGFRDCTGVFLYGGRGNFGLDIRRCEDVKVEKCTFTGGGFITASKKVLLKSVVFEGEGRGLVITNCFENRDATIKRWRGLWPSLELRPPGVSEALGSRPVQLQACQFSKSTWPAILASRANIQVWLCHFKDLKGRGIELQDGSLGNIVDNEMTNVIGHGIFFWESEGSIFGNRITKVRPSAQTLWSYGIEQICPAPKEDELPPYVLICNNQVKDSGSVGMQVRGGRGPMHGNTVEGCERGAILRRGIAGRFGSFIRKTSVYGLHVEQTDGPLEIGLTMDDTFGVGISMLQAKKIKLQASIRDQGVQAFRDKWGKPLGRSGPAPPKTLVGGVYLRESQVDCQSLRIANADATGSLIVTGKSEVTGYGRLRNGGGDGIAVLDSTLSGTWHVDGHEGIGYVVDGGAAVSLKDKPRQMSCAFNVGGGYHVDGGSTLTLDGYWAYGKPYQGGLYAIGARILGGSTLKATRSAFVDFSRAHVWVSGRSSAELTRCSLHVNRFKDWGKQVYHYSGDLDGLRVDSGSKLTFANGGGAAVYGGRVARAGPGGTLIIKNCKSELKGHAGDCITVESGGAAHIEGNTLRTFAEPRFNRPAHCVQVLDGGEAVIRNNTMHSTFSSEIVLRKGSKADIIGNALNSRLRPDKGEVGIQLEQGVKMTIKNNRGPGASEVYIDGTKVNPDGTRPGGNE